MGEYKNWAVFPPKETTPERMGKVILFFIFILKKINKI